MQLDTQSNATSPTKQFGMATDGRSIASTTNVIEKMQRAQQKDLERIVKKFNYDMELLNKHKIMSM